MKEVKFAEKRYKQMNQAEKQKQMTIMEDKFREKGDPIEKLFLKHGKRK